MMQRRTVLSRLNEVELDKSFRREEKHCQASDEVIVVKKFL
jgi:hypothetical protein